MHRKRCNGWADEQNVLHLIQNELCHTQGVSVTEFFLIACCHACAFALGGKVDFSGDICRSLP